MKPAIMVVAAGILAVSFAQAGSGWGPGTGARWIFSCVGDGIAVQDFWMPNAGGFGTNLRTYNPDTESRADVYRIKATRWED